MLPTRGLFLLVKLTDKILTCTDSDRVGWKSSTDLRVITFFQHNYADPTNFHTLVLGFKHHFTCFVVAKPVLNKW